MSALPPLLHSLLLLLLLLIPSHSRRTPNPSTTPNATAPLTYLWPLPRRFRSGDQTLTVSPDLALRAEGPGGGSRIVREAFRRYRDLVFGYRSGKGSAGAPAEGEYDVEVITIVVASGDETLRLGVDESYTLYVGSSGGRSIVKGSGIEANTIYGALRAFETFSQLCTFNYKTKNVEVDKAPWFIQDEPRFPYRGLLIDTSRHYLPVSMIKQVIESMSYAKFNVLHWHIVDEESFPIEIPSYPYLWKGAYTKWERFTVEDAYEIVDFARKRGINVMAEIDVPGHAEAWGKGYPDLWPSPTCKEPLDVSNNFTFEVISGILSDLRKIFPFELFHLGGDEVNTDCWNSTSHIKQWLRDQNMTTKDAYQYFVLRAQDIAIAHNWTPVNWEETFNSFNKSLNPQTVVHNWYRSGVCQQAVAKGFRCIASNQGMWYLDHLDASWEKFYMYEPLDGINKTEHKKLVLGGEVCMWGETADPSDEQQTIWPRAAAAAERLWSGNSSALGNINSTVLPRLQYFRCLLNRRGVAAAPVNSTLGRMPPIGPGSCYDQ